MNRRSLIVAVIMTLIGLTFSSVDALAQRNVEVKSTAVPKANGTRNPNIKADAPTSDARPVAKVRGESCVVKFDNHSGLFIKVYVDGNYKGTLDAWGAGTVTVAGGYTKIYCISAGGTKEWNASGDCEGRYTYTLR